MATHTRDRILDALEALLLDQGLTHVTLEAVAAATGISKGGLLYHFPSKDALIAGMVRRLGERSDAQLDVATAGGTSVSRWYLQQPDSSVAGNSDDREVELYRSTLAALRSIDGKPGEVQQAMTEVMRLWDEGIRREIADPVHAEIVRLVGDGIYLGALLNLPKIDPELHSRVVDRLLRNE